jgi:hypothetical protein
MSAEQNSQLLRRNPNDPPQRLHRRRRQPPGRASLLAAPAIIRTPGLIMPIKPLPDAGFVFSGFYTKVIADPLMFQVLTPDVVRRMMGTMWAATPVIRTSDALSG